MKDRIIQVKVLILLPLRNMNNDQMTENREVVEVSTHEVDELNEYEEINDDDLYDDNGNTYLLSLELSLILQ